MDVWATHKDSGGAAKEDAYGLSETMRMTEEDLKGTGYYDVYHYNTPLAALAELNPPVLTTLTSIMDDISWGDITSPPKMFSQYQGQLMSVPADDDTWLMYYRTDLVAVPPATWDEYVATAARLNGTDMNGDGEPDYGACIDTSYLSHMLMTVAASTSVFTDGKRTGMVWDIQDDDHQHMKSLMTAEPWRLAMRILERLAPFTPAVGGQEVPIDRTYSLWKSGRCAVTLTFPSSGALTNAEGAHIRGKLGAAPPPGSAEVWDRETQTMVPCNAKLCRWALPHPTKGGGHLINRPAFAPSPMKFVVNKRSSELQQALAFVSFATVNVDPRVAGGLNPFRRSHYDAAYFVAGGWDPSDASNYTAGLKDVTTRVQAVIPGIPTVASLQSTINEFAGRLIGLVQPDGSRAAPGSLDREALLVSMNAAVEQRFLEQGYSMTAVEAAHRRSLGLPPLIIPAELATFPIWIPLVAASALTLLLLVMVAFVIWFVLKRRAFNRDPRDASKPFAVFFVAMKNESAVRDAYGAEVDSAVFPALRRLVARTAERHNCVAARHIDAHHMLVAKNPADALRCADAILQAAASHRWQGTNSHPARVLGGEELFSSTIGSGSALALPVSRPSLTFPRPSLPSVPGSLDKPHHYAEKASIMSRSRVAAPLLSVGLEFAVGCIDDAGGRAPFYGGPPVAAAAALADVAQAGSVVMRRETADEVRRSGFAAGAPQQPSDNDSLATSRASDFLGEVGVFDFGPSLPAAALSALEQSSSDDVTTECFWSVPPAPVSGRGDGAAHRDGDESGITDDTAATGGLAAALQQASGALCSRRVAVVAVNVPVLRADPRGQDGERRGRNEAATSGLVTEAARILAGVAGESRAACLSASDGIFIFAINAVVPTMRATDRAIAAAHAAVGALNDAGIRATAGLGVGAAAAGEFSWYCPRRTAMFSHPAVHGTCCEEARLMALFADAVGGGGSEQVGSIEPPPSSHASVLASPAVSAQSANCQMEIVTLVKVPVWLRLRGPATKRANKLQGSLFDRRSVDASPAPPSATQNIVPLGRVLPAGEERQEEWMYQLQSAANIPFAATNDLYTALIASIPRLPEEDEAGMCGATQGAVTLRRLVADVRARLSASAASTNASVADVLGEVASTELLQLLLGDGDSADRKNR